MEYTFRQVVNKHNKENDSMKAKVQEALELIRPALQADGGDVELVDVSDDGIVSVKLTGACGSCPMSTMTLKMGIEKTLMAKIPEVKEVVQVRL
jgi:Fe-S cluster biogenesis protein NfuA